MNTQAWLKVSLADNLFKQFEPRLWVIKYWASHGSKLTLLIFLMLYVPVNNFSVISGQLFLGLTSTKQWIKYLAQGHSDSASSEARTSNLSIPSPTPYQLTGPPHSVIFLKVFFFKFNFKKSADDKKTCSYPECKVNKKYQPYSV